MKYISKNIVIIVILGIILFAGSCRKQYQATEEHMADYGWLLFENSSSLSDYKNSKTWFLSSVNEDTTYMDGYNGLGWVYGKLTDLDSSIFYYSQALKFSPGLYDTTNIRREIWAGLIFANNAKGLDSTAIVWGDSLFPDWNGTNPGISPWLFSHNIISSNNIINHLDVLVTLAAANYAIGEFDNSLAQIQEILSQLKSTTILSLDLNTIAGRTELAFQIQSLQEELSKK